MNTEIQPSITSIKDIRPFHARITMEPFERGYGHTLGIALRRVILSAVPGYAATEVRIEGAEHQYTTLPGVSEDVVDILLNLKGVSFKLDGMHKTDQVKIQKSGPCTVTAGDLDLPAGAHVLNPSHHLATISTDAKLNMSITVESGLGYRPAAVADRDRDRDRDVGVIRLDAAFSPVRNVAFDVESTRVGDRTDLDRLVIELKTTGIFDPEEIIRFAAGQLIQRLQFFANLDRGVSPLAAMVPSSDAKENKLFYDSIEILELTVRVTNNLKQDNIFFIGDLVGMTEDRLKRTPRLGRKSVDEIKLALARHNLELGMSVAGYDPERV